MASLSHGNSYEILDQCLKDILLFVKPTQYDQTKREYIMNELRPVVQCIETDAVVRPFGSFVSNLYTKGGDLDISIELSHCTSKKNKTSLLWKIRNVLVRQKRDFACEVKVVPYARIPLLAFESRRGNISCDVTINNQLGYIKSRIFSWISQIDERFRDMVLLIKEWAKAQYINDPKTGTLNSHSLCLLVVFHFQRWSPAILPPLKDICEGNIAQMTGSWSDHERQIEDKCAANIAKFMTSRQKNSSSLSELLISFFDKFKNIDRDASKLVICPYTGTFEERESNPIWMEKPCNLLVADPFDQNDNPARSVSSVGLTNISEAFTSTYQKLCLSSVLSDRDALLAILIRPSICSDLRVSTSNPTSQEPHVEYSGFTMHGPEHEPEFKVRRDSNRRFSTQNATSHRPWGQYSGNIMQGQELDPGHRVRRDSNSWSSTQNPTFQRPMGEYSGLIVHGQEHEPEHRVRTDSNRWSSTQNPTFQAPQAEYSGFIMHGPVHEPRPNVIRDSNGSSSTRNHTPQGPLVEYPGLITLGPVHELRPNVRRDSNGSSSTRNHTTQGPLVEYPGLITHGPVHEPRPNVRRDSNGSSSTRNHTRQGPLIEYPGLITHGPEPIRILRRDNNGLSLTQDRTFRGKGIRYENTPQFHISVPVLHRPVVGEPVIKATNDYSTSQSSSTAVTKQGQGPHVWRPKSSNRNKSSLLDQP